MRFPIRRLKRLTGGLATRLTVRASSLGLLLALSSPAHASVTELLERLGGMLSQTPKPPGVTGQDKERRLVLNGQPLHLITGHTVRPVRETLEFYRLKLEDQSQAAQRGLKMVGLQQVTDQSGFILLVDPQSREVLAEIAKRKQELLSAGPLRMVSAVRRGSGTDYLMVWTDKPLSVSSWIPTVNQDAAGTDIPEVPRPVGAVRSLSIYEPAAGYGLVQYRLPGSVDAALRDAKETLLSAGFREDPDAQLVAQKSASPLLLLVRQRHSVTVKARPRPSQGSEVTYLWRAQ